MFLHQGVDAEILSTRIHPNIFYKCQYIDDEIAIIFLDITTAYCYCFHQTSESASVRTSNKTSSPNQIKARRHKTLLTQTHKRKIPKDKNTYKKRQR